MTEQELKLVSCSNCRRFISDDIGSGKGIGKCAAFEVQVRHGIPIQRLNLFFKTQLGGKLFWGGDGDDRYCVKFVEKG